MSNESKIYGCEISRQLCPWSLITGMRHVNCVSCMRFKLKSFDSPARAVWRMQVERSNSLLNSKLESDLFVSLQATRTSPASRGMVEARHRNAAVTLTKDSPGEYQQRLPAFRRYRPADMSRKPLVL